MREQTPIKIGLVKEVNGELKFIGSRCTKCGQTYFPSEIRCLNCGFETLQEVSLSPEGKLYSYSKVEMPCAHFKPPYAVGFVDMPEGVRIFGQLDIKNEKPFKIGMKMKIYLDVLWNEDGKDVMGYRFSPL